MPRTYFSDLTIDDLMRRVITEIRTHGYTIAPTKGPATELAGVLLNLRDPRLMHPLICRYQITPKISLNTRCSASMLPNFSIKGRLRSSGQLGRW